MSAQNSILVGMLAAVAVALGIAVASWYYAPQPGAPGSSGTLLATPRPLPEFALIDHEGQPFTRERLQGGWSLVFAGFARCPDVCPSTLKMLQETHAQLAAQGKKVNVVFLSVDPDRDTPAALKSYATHFDPSFTGVTAPEPRLGEFAGALGLAYAKVPGERPDDYQVTHSAALVLIDPQARIAGYFSPPFQAATLASDLAHVLDRPA